jgi:hypothetical protein
VVDGIIEETMMLPAGAPGAAPASA